MLHSRCSDTQVVVVGQDRSLAEMGSLHGNVHTLKPSEIPFCLYAECQFLLNLAYLPKCCNVVNVAQKISGIAAGG